MTLATATLQPTPVGSLSWRDLQAIIDAHNLGVIDDHVICAKLDADIIVDDTDYEDQLTALEIQYEGYTATEAIAVPRFFTDFPVNLVSEDIINALIVQMNARITDARVIQAKLDLDANVPFANYDEASNRVVNSVRVMDEAGVEQDGVVAIRVLPSLANNQQASMLATIGESNAGQSQARWIPGITMLAVTTPDAGNQARILASHDAGYTWFDLATLPVTVTVVTDLVVNTIESAILISGNTATEAVIYRSVDGGLNWTDVADAAAAASVFFGQGTINRLFAASNGNFLAGGDQAQDVFLSDDFGLTWTLVAELGAGADTWSFGETRLGTLLAGGDEGILYSSTDGGTTWGVEEDHSGDVLAITDILGNTKALSVIVLGPEAAGDAATVVSLDDMVTWETAVHLPAGATASRLVQGPTGILYVANGVTLIYLSVDEAATYETEPANLAGQEAINALMTDGKRVFVGTNDTTSFGAIWAIEDISSLKLTGLSEAPTPPEFPVPNQGSGAGTHGSQLTKNWSQQNRLTQNWRDITTRLDADVLTDSDYEAQLTAERVSQKVS